MVLNIFKSERTCGYRETVVSLETQTRTTGEQITVLLRTLTHGGYHLHKKRKNTGTFIFQALQNGVKHN